MNVTCDYCGKPAWYVDSAIVYHGHSYGMIYYCPDCQAWVGVHQGTDKPLGRLANAELRQCKQMAHAAFDKLWIGKSRWVRRAAYKWLAAEMGLPEEETHIGMFDKDKCMQVVRICEGGQYEGFIQGKKAQRAPRHLRHRLR